MSEVVGDRAPGGAAGATACLGARGEEEGSACPPPGDAEADEGAGSFSGASAGAGAKQLAGLPDGGHGLGQRAGGESLVPVVRPAVNSPELLLLTWTGPDRPGAQVNVVRESDGARVSTYVEMSEPADILVKGGRIRTVQDTGHWSGGAQVSSTAVFNGGGRVVMAGLGESSGAGSRAGD